MQYDSLQHQNLLPSPVISTTGCCFCFGSVSSFFMELFLHYSLVAYWTPTDLGSSSFSVLTFCLFILFMGFSRNGNGTPLQYSCPEKSHGWRSLVGCSPCGREESDTTERLHFHFPLSCIGEGNGNPLQYSCLGNPMDRDAWQARVHRVAKKTDRT